MNKRKKTSGGQAIVMVTLALFAMVGMLGLSVDLGWSYFVQKEAQAAADAAALGAARDAMYRIQAGGGAPSAFTCAGTGVQANGVDCEQADGGQQCKGSVAIAGNLYNGCLYAQSNGFDFANTNAKQYVTMQSGDGNDANRPPGVNRISYWVRARTHQDVPQLFSYLAGNKVGTVFANATAAIAGSIQPGNFYGMNHKGDCWSLPGQPGVNCGMDLDNGAKGTIGTCPSGGTGTACAPAGIILSSSCSAVGAGCSQAWAADGGTHGGVETSYVVLPSGGLAINDFHQVNGTAAPRIPATAAATFQDPTQGNPQPPLQTNTAIPSCGLPDGVLSGNAGPFQYYAYSFKDGFGKPRPSGAPIKISGNVTFTNTSNAATCPGGYLSGGTNQGGTFNSFIFYGGIYVGGTMNLIAGQYVMAGVANAGAAGGLVLDTPSSGGTIQAADATAKTTGTQFIFTDGSYPGLGGPKSQGGTGIGQIAAVPNWDQMPPLYQGSINLKNSNITMDGLVNSTVTGSGLPPTMDPYTGVVWWQDRRNSMVEYNQCTSLCANPTKSPNYSCSYPSDPTACTKDDGRVVGCADQNPGLCGSSQTTGEIVTDNHVTSTSPGVTLDPGTGSVKISGVYYQPRGAWIQLLHGNVFGSGNFQFVTGSLQLTTGDDKVLLQGPTNPLLTYKTVLIQ